MSKHEGCAAGVNVVDLWRESIVDVQVDSVLGFGSVKWLSDVSLVLVTPSEVLVGC